MKVNPKIPKTPSRVRNYITMGAADFVPKNGINGINGITMVFVIVAFQLCMGVWLVVPKGVVSEKGQNQHNSKNFKNSIL